MQSHQSIGPNGGPASVQPAGTEARTVGTAMTREAPRPTGSSDNGSRVAQAAIAALGELRPNELEALVKNSVRRQLSRGEVLIRQGDPSDELCFVLSGRFVAQREGSGEPQAEIGQGQPIGEMGFFAGLRRTATITALRDSTVLAISRERFHQVSELIPTLRETVIAALAHRLVGTLRIVEANATIKEPPIPRTLAVVWAGDSRPSLLLLELMRDVFGKRSRSIFLTQEDVSEQFPERPLDDAAISAWLNSLELQADFVFYIADHGLTEWTQKSIRQADAVLLVATAASDFEINASELFAFAIHPASARRLIVLHDKRAPIALGTSSWLAQRDVFMHHHVSLQDKADVQRLYRFLSGRAVGFVAGGGGALGTAHLGVYKAFCEVGADFDILGGTSVGAAMTASLASGLGIAAIDEHTQKIVARRALQRLTVPRYGLLNHKILDDVLQDEYGESRIEDLWRPYFAVSTNLSNNSRFIHRRGLIWTAVRASGSLPGVLPPFFTKQGEMLVDGGLIENVPLESMKALKSGPNVVVALSIYKPRTYPVDYGKIPGPAGLLAAMLNPFARHSLPKVPNLLQVIEHSMLANRKLNLPLNSMNMLVEATLPPGAHWNRWDSHTEVFMSGYYGAASTLRQAMECADPRLTAIMRALD